MLQYDGYFVDSTAEASKNWTATSLTVDAI